MRRPRQSGDWSLSQFDRLNMHPVKIPLSPEAKPAFGFPSFPPRIVFGTGEICLVATPFQLVARRIKIQCNTPGMGWPGRAAAFFTLVKTAAIDVQAQIIDLILGVFRGDGIQNALKTVGDLFVAADFGRCDIAIPVQLQLLGADHFAGCAFRVAGLDVKRFQVCLARAVCRPIVGIVAPRHYVPPV